MQPALQKCKDTSVFLHLTISCLTSGSHSCSHIETKTATYKELFATNPDKKFTWEVLFHWHCCLWNSFHTGAVQQILTATEECPLESSYELEKKSV